MSRTGTLERASSKAGLAPIRTFRNAVAFLESLPNFEKVPPGRNVARTMKLSRMQKLAAALGNPQKQFRCAHIAGTKGKGSTCAMLAAMLRNNGLNVGLYSSPHLMDVRERIQVNDRFISEADMAKLVAKVAAVARSMKNDRPTYFEVLTAVAFLYFAQRKIDIAVIETGLGGRLDATNIVRPDVVGITNISFDHMQFLGNTITQIAEEKAGIFKPGVPVIAAQQIPDAKKTLIRVAQKVGCPMMFAGEDFEFSSRFEASRATGPQTRICVSTTTSHFEHLHVPLLGEHQAMNCAVAIGMLDQLKQRGFKVDPELSIAGLAKVSLPGRMEVIHHEPRVIVDGAHNAASIEALMRAIGQNVTYDSMVVIFGCNGDKDVEGMLKLLALGADKVIFTRSTNARAVPPAELAANFKEWTGRAEQFAETLEDSLAIAGKAVARDDLICITGSFYLVADAKRLFARKGEGRLQREATA